ncbi:MAG TPA: PQQ-binding-like beta-propeller repeat protein, partial [Bacteroidia bacterium]
YNTESCTIFATDAKSGKYLWSHWLGDPLMSMPAVANEKVFTAYPSNTNFSFNEEVKENGKTIYTMKASHVLAAFDLKTGNVLWQKWIDGDVMSAPVADGDNLYITSFPGTVYKFSQKDGEILSAKYMRATSAPIIKDGEMTVSRRTDNEKDSNAFETIARIDETKMAVTKQYGKKEATYLSKNVQQKSQLKTTSMSYDAGNGFAGGAPASSGAYVAENNIGQSNVSSLQSFQGSRILSYKGKHYNTMGDEIVCTDKDGKTSWSEKLSGDMHTVGGFLGTPPLAVGGKIIVATYNGEIQIMDAETGKVETKYDTKENIRYQPVVQDGWIYVTTTSGKMIAINTGNASLTGWPMWGGNAQHTNIVE